jgi:ribosome-binding protein aMBF1 (putative translation factor)
MTCDLLGAKRDNGHILWVTGALIRVCFSCGRKTHRRAVVHEEGNICGNCQALVG